jgi:methylated-DNA-[protein]-cysteine S-methyltransferase
VLLGIAGHLWLKNDVSVSRLTPFLPPPRPGDNRGTGVRIAVRRLATPLGPLEVAASDEGVLYVDFRRAPVADRAMDRWVRGHILSRRETPILRAALRELREYVAGRRRVFTVPLNPTGSLFQRRVWRVVAAIPFGETRTYCQIAEAIGEAKAARAVGAAVGANPIPILIPCHRVIGADGSLTGFTAGLHLKIWLLRHEGVLLA